MKELALADKAIEDAQKEQDKAAAELVQEKKKSIRMSRSTDMTYVVYQARL